MTSVAVRRLPTAEPTWQREAEVVVVGAGAAGLSTALTAAGAGRRVLLLCKGPLGDGATTWAQGGLAAALDVRDSPDLHARDTLVAGAGLCDEAAVHALVAAAPGEIQRLYRLGARFDTSAAGTSGARPPAYSLTREGGHSRDRVVHAGGDASGAEVSRALLAALRASTIEVLAGAAALDLLTDETGRAAGLTVGLVGASGFVPGLVRARAVVLATGGLGHAYASTTNPTGATGDGLALALRAGAELRDVEFVQFHPTVLWQGLESRGQQVLVSEAVRGEGAVLVDATGRPVMAGRHPLGDLAPRDVVAATMHECMQAAPGGVTTHLFLDATRLGRATLERRFPTVLAACRAAGVDPVTEPVPVAPGAHYACGGVRADLSGRTSVPGLFAVGEVAGTGVHGANRLASNSITEALVTGRLAGELLARRLPTPGEPAPGEWVPGTARGGLAGVDPTARATTASATSRDAGVLRSGEGLDRLLAELAAVPAATGATLDVSVVEGTNLHTVSTLVATAARVRAESRGCHRRADAPGARPTWERHVTLRLAGDRLVVTLDEPARAA